MNPIRRVYYIFRNSRTGRFITQDKAKQHPGRTTREQIIRDAVKAKAERDAS